MPIEFSKQVPKNSTAQVVHTAKWKGAVVTQIDSASYVLNVRDDGTAITASTDITSNYSSGVMTLWLTPAQNAIVATDNPPKEQHQIIFTVTGTVSGQSITVVDEAVFDVINTPNA